MREHLIGVIKMNLRLQPILNCQQLNILGKAMNIFMIMSAFYLCGDLTNLNLFLYFINYNFNYK